MSHYCSIAIDTDAGPGRALVQQHCTTTQERLNIEPMRWDLIYYLLVDTSASLAARVAHMFTYAGIIAQNGDIVKTMATHSRKSDACGYRQKQRGRQPPEAGTAVNGVPRSISQFILDNIFDITYNLHMSDTLTTKEAAQELGVSQSTIQKWYAHGAFPDAYKLNPASNRPNSPLRIPRADIESIRYLRAVNRFGG
jgi:predicted DNA-binding transcriptional regulator AlpA